MNKHYPRLFEPLTIKNITFRNRVFSAPNMMCHMYENGYPTDYMIGYYEAKAKGGAALVTVGDTPVDREHAATNPHSFNLSRDSLPFVSELAKAIKSHGAVASLELNHGGQVGVPAANGGNNPIGPTGFIREDGVEVIQMDEVMMDKVADNYASSAELLKTAGFDMCLLHGAHGWLLDQFISPLFNRRSDEYGGSLENRAKFPLLVIDRVRERVGEDFLIEYRISGEECIEGGLQLEESIAFAKMLEGRVDLLHVSAGLDTTEEQAVITHPTIFLPHGVNVKYADAMKKEVNIPIVTVGGITDPDFAEDILESGKADVIAMTRAIIADPEWANKAKKGRAAEIIPCMRCLDCLTGMHTGEHFACAANPWTGREFRLRNSIQPAKESKNVLVIGGGPAGMNAAITAFDRGHRVTIAEKHGYLGGNTAFSDKDTLKTDLRRFKNYLIHGVTSRNIKVLLNTAADKEFSEKGSWDAIIVAAGAEKITPAIPGIENKNVMHATEIYTRIEELGKTAVIIGGGLVGCETSIFLAERGIKTTIVEMRSELAPDSNWMHRQGMMAAIEQENISIQLNSKVLSISSEGVHITDDGSQKKVIPADTVIYAVGLRANSEVFNEIRDSAEDVVSAGDCRKPRKVCNAVFESYFAAVDLS